MSVLRSALLKWNANHATRVLVAGLAVYLSIRFTDGYLIGIGTVVLFAFLLDIPLAVVDRTADQSQDE